MQSKELKKVKTQAKRRAKAGSDCFPFVNPAKLFGGELQSLSDGEHPKYQLVWHSGGFALRYLPTDDEREAWALKEIYSTRKE